MQDFVSLAIVGAFVSVVVQFIKSNTSVNPRIVVIGLSVVAGAGYFFLRDSSFWTSGSQVLLYANAFYGFIISNFE